MDPFLLKKLILVKPWEHCATIVFFAWPLRTLLKKPVSIMMTQKRTHLAILFPSKVFIVWSAGFYISGAEFRSYSVVSILKGAMLNRHDRSVKNTDLVNIFSDPVGFTIRIFYCAMCRGNRSSSSRSFMFLLKLLASICFFICVLRVA